MKLSDLNRLIENLLTGDQFKQLIKKEVSTYCELMPMRGSTIPLIVDEDQEIILDDKAIKKLLEDVIKGKLSNVDLAYICDCISVSENVTLSDEKVENIVFGIADPEINGGFKSDWELQQLIEDL